MKKSIIFVFLILLHQKICLICRWKDYCGNE